MSAATLLDLNAAHDNAAATPHSTIMSPRAANPISEQASAIAPARYDRLVLTGFMGSGKSTIGALLAHRLGWSFLDLDHEIERREGRTVPQIFVEHGEAHFRRRESAALAAVLGRKRTVIALGGGVPEELGNRLLLEQSPRTAVIYLDAPFDELLARCNAQPNATDRPNLADTATAAQRFERRRHHYERIARVSVQTSGQTAEQTLEHVLTAIGAQE